MLDEVEALLSGAEAAGEVDARELLEGHFDVVAKYREVFWMILRDMSLLSCLDLTQDMLDWRRRFNALLVGDAATPAEWARALLR